MRSPLRLLNAWIDHQRLSERRSLVEWQLSIVLRQSVTLLPTVSGSGFDRKYLVQTNSRPTETIACVRMNCPWRGIPPEIIHLPRKPLKPEQRIAREARAYELLAPLGIVPKLIARGEYFLANHWLPWPRLSEVLKRSPASLWRALPPALEAVRQMHSRGVVHMDLNCGNLLISPDFTRVVLIDFEYAPRTNMTFFDQQRFDYLRLAHDLLKPRRGREAALCDPGRFIESFARVAPESGFGIPEPLAAESFCRVLEHSTIRIGFEELFGVFETECVCSPLLNVPDPSM